MDNLPKILIDNIKNKNVVLFLGSGFSYNAIHSEGKQPPLGGKLAEMIAKEFLGEEFIDSPLTYVSDLSISESNLFDVQSFIAEIFENFYPNKNHEIYTTLPWKAIFTTNYDLILERAYKKSKNKNQDISVVYRNTPEPQIFRTPNTVAYYKLHGCISYINDPDLPLILSTEQYLTHQNNRDRLFKKLEELSLDYPFVFVGYSNQDHNIRAILRKIESIKDGRPRSFMVSPYFSDAECRYWEERKITPLRFGHEEFIQRVNDSISETEKKLAIFRTSGERKVYERFTVNPKELKPTESLRNFLDYESEYIHGNIKLGDTTAQAFYKGFLSNWDPIVKKFDFRRSLENRILTDLVLEDTYQEEKKSFVFLIKGFAGSGKSVLLRRIAWETAVELEKLVLYIKPGQALRFDPVLELYNYVKERIYLFVDNAVDNQQSIVELINKANKEGVPVTIITAERISSLNEDNIIVSHITQDYKLMYLTETEVDELLYKLEENNSLGYLESKTYEERKKEFEQRSGRELLVALYEATGGKPFEEIILDEYQGIGSEEAKSLYLTVSVFHRLGTKVRAGLISRIHNISFVDFEKKLFKPLEFIVFNERDYYINDFVYSTRHPFIAQMIFEQVLSTEQERYDEYIRLLQNIDIDYNSDWNAFLDIIKARNLRETFNDPIKVRNIYALAEELNPDDPKLLQQRGIFQMTSSSGNLFSAEKLLKKAYELAPKDMMISHSLAEISLKKAERTEIEIERIKHLERAEKLCNSILRQSKEQMHSFHTLLKVKLFRFKIALSSSFPSSIEKRMKEFEKTLSEVKQFYPDHEFILEIEARFNEALDDEPSAIELLGKAFSMNKASPYLAIRYSKLLKKNDNIDGAIKALQDTLQLNPNDRDVNYQLANFLMEKQPQNFDSYIYLYRRAFTKGDTRFEAQFWYARSLYLSGDIEEAKLIFKSLATARMPPSVKNKLRGEVYENESISQFKGEIVKHESSYAFIRRSKFGDDIFLYRDNLFKNWSDFKVGVQVNFNLAFNYKGPICINPGII